MPWTEQEYREYMERFYGRGTENRAPDPAPNLESPVPDEPVAAKAAPRYDSPCRIHVHSVRRRLADPDGISGKAAIDGLVHAGILRDDSPEYVKEVSYSQEKTKGQEYTVLTITPAG